MVRRVNKDPIKKKEVQRKISREVDTQLSDGIHQDTKTDVTRKILRIGTSHQQPLPSPKAIIIFGINHECQ